MDKPTIATKLLILLASGATIERIVADLPGFQTRIESILTWMKTPRIRSHTEIAEKAARLREVMHQKDQALKLQDFDRAAVLRGEERALFESFWLQTPQGDTGDTIMHVGIDKQIEDLAALLHDTNAA